MSARESAALERRANIAAHADRPSKRRSAPEEGSGAFVRATVSGIELRTAADYSGTLTFTRYASVVEPAYAMYNTLAPYTHIDSAGPYDPPHVRPHPDYPSITTPDSPHTTARR